MEFSHSLGRRVQHAIERVRLERIADLQVLVERGVGAVPVETLEVVGRTPRSMPVVRAPRLRLWPPMALRSKPAAAARAWMMRATVRASMAWVPTTRAGRGDCR